MKGRKRRKKKGERKVFEIAYFFVNEFY